MIYLQSAPGMLSETLLKVSVLACWGSNKWKVLQNLDNSDLSKTEIAHNASIFTAVTRNHGNGQKSPYRAKITVITAIVNS